MGLAFVILVRSEIGDTEIKRDVYDLEEKGFHLFFMPSFLLFVLGFWLCSVGCVPELRLTVTVPLTNAHCLGREGS